jgi:eukaryotic-like serine/threonine-protein kinase
MEQRCNGDDFAVNLPQARGTLRARFRTSLMEQRSSRVRFGSFELDLESGELKQIGGADPDSTTLLREQPFQVLRMLVERGGKIVTREEIKKRLWPNDTIVDFDQSINAAIRVLRRALGESADNPAYIETLARRGYRLRAPVQWLAPTSGVPRREAAIADAPVESGLIGRKVSHYRVIEVIGGGGMGMVYKAEDIKLGRRVALKFLPEELAGDPINLRRLEREAQTASALNHPNICTIHEIEESQGQPFIVMELLDGDSLHHRLSIPQAEPFPLAELFDIAIQVCDGLQAAHDKGIIHRDIKPANIFLTRHRAAKILDFGLAKLSEPAELGEHSDGGSHAQQSDHTQITLTRTGSPIGTAGYMSPEQVRGEKLDARTDLFSFGLVLYELATGQRAFAGKSAAVVHEAILNHTPPAVHDLNPALPRGLDAVINRALQKDRSLRFQSAMDIRKALEHVRSDFGHTKTAYTRRVLATAAALAVLAVGVWKGLASFHTGLTLSPSDTVVLADITNHTGDSVFDMALYMALQVAFEQTPYLDVMALAKATSTMKLLNLPEGTRLTPEVATQVCHRTNSRIAVAASIADAGNHFRVGLKAIDCQSGITVAQIEEDAGSRNDVVKALGSVAVKLRQQLGEPADYIAKFSKPLDEATSRSPEAVQLLADGYLRHLAGDVRGALALYDRAVEIDPSFALAHVARSAAHSNAGDEVGAAEAVTQAFELRSRMTEPGRLHVEEQYYVYVTGEQEKSCAVLEQWVRTFPHSFIGHNNLGQCLQLLGQVDQALAAEREAARLQPSTRAYANLMGAYIRANRFDEAETTFKDARSQNFDGQELRETRALLAFLQRDNRAMQEQWDWATGKRGAEHDLLHGKAAVEAYYGHFRTARQLRERAEALAANEGVSVQYLFLGAQDEALAGYTDGPRRLAAQNSNSRDQSVRARAALIFAETGDVERARRLVDALDHDAPVNTIVQNLYLPTVRAAMKLHAKDPGGAVEILRRADKLELSTAGFNSLEPAYLRGQAYLQIGEGAMAATEFKKLLDHPGVVGRSVSGALSRLQVARSLSLSGDREAARKSYEEFLDLWKDADPEVPAYRDAKAEYAALLKGGTQTVQH